MPSLSDQLLGADRFEAVVSDCRAMVEAEVASRGRAVRTALGLAKRAKPGVIDKGVRILLPDFAHALEPFHADYLTDGRGSGAFGDYLLSREDEAAAALLAVTDTRVAEVRSRSVRSGYERLRGRGEDEVKASLPAIAAVVSRHVPGAGADH